MNRDGTSNGNGKKVTRKRFVSAWQYHKILVTEFIRRLRPHQFTDFRKGPGKREKKVNKVKKTVESEKKKAEGLEMQLKSSQPNSSSTTEIIFVDDPTTFEGDHARNNLSYMIS